MKVRSPSLPLCPKTSPLARRWPRAAALGPLAALVTGLVLATAAAGPGSVDLTFDLTAGGALPGLEDPLLWWPLDVRAVAVQPDGRILAGGNFRRVNGIPRPELARFHPDGALDLSFEPPPDLDYRGHALAVQPDGKVLLGGFRTIHRGVPTLRQGITRLKPDGSLDESFYVGLGALGPVNCIGLLPDGRILVAGCFSQFNGVDRAGVARLHPNGALDLTFVPPALTIRNDEPGDGINALVVQPDGKIVVGGGGIQLDDHYVSLLRLNADGSLDPTFQAEVYPSALVWALALQADGRILVGVDPYWAGSTLSSGLQRLRPDGTLDPSFNAALGFVRALRVLWDGRILAGGGDFNLTLLLPDGSPDPTFRSGASGIETLALQPDGQIVVGGSFTEIDGFPIVGLARLNGAAPLPPRIVLQPVSQTRFVGQPVTFTVQATGTPPLRYQWFRDGLPLTGATHATLSIASVQFADAGAYWVVVRNAAGSVQSQLAALTVLPAVPSQFCAGEPDRGFRPSLITLVRVTALARQPDGRLLIGGDYSPPVARLYADGSLDATFASSVEGEVGNLVLQPDGKVLVSGYLRSAGRLVQLARIRPDGTVDPGFHVALGTNQGASVTQMALQPDGKVLIAGWFTHVNGQFQPGLARLNSDGSLDAGFAPDPAWASAFTTWAMLLQADGRVVLSGQPGPGSGRPSVLRLNADGSLDSSFRVSVEGTVSHLAAQPGGRILMAGDFFAVNGVPRPTLARFNPDGSLDLSFKSGAGPSGLGIAWVHRLFPLRDGRVIVSGDFSDNRYGLLRLNPDGSLDPDFEVVLADTTDEDDPSAYALAEEPEGRVLVGGYFNRVNGLEHRLLVRLFTESRNCAGFVSFGAPVTYTDEPGGRARIPLLRTAGASGTLAVHYATTNLEAVAGADYAATHGVLTFADGETRKEVAVPVLNDSLREANERFALVLTAPTNARPLRGDASRTHKVVIVDDENAGRPGSLDRTFVAPLEPGYQVQDMALQPDGRILLCGTFKLPGAMAYDGLARLQPNGALDPAFNPAAAHWRGVTSVALQPDGKILIGGYFAELGGAARLRLARLQPDGSLAPGFTPQVGHTNDVGREVQDILLQPDGRVLVGGCFDRVNGVPRKSIARLQPDGSLDTGFAAAGVSWHNNLGSVHQMALQPDGKIVVAGQFLQVNGVPRTNLARLNPDGSLDATFNPTCLTNGVVKSVAVQPDGKVVVGGSFNYRGNETMTVLRLNADGSLDAAFQPPIPGRVSDYYDLRPEVCSLALQPDGKILMAGIFTRVNGVGRNHIARLNPDGSLDLGFLPGAGLNGWATRVLSQPGGEVLVAGRFTEADFLPRCFMVRLNGDPPPPGPFVRRQINRPTVELLATPLVTVSVYAVEDHPPTHWLVANISHGGVFDAATGEVKFGPFLDSEPRTLSYTVTPPPGAQGVFAFQGQASADGVNTPITGDEHCVIAGLHPAEHREWQPADWRLTMDEVTAYASAWRRGLTWPVPPHLIPMDYVTRAAWLWRRGECYRVDAHVTTPPLWWVPCEDPPLTQAGDSSQPPGNVQRHVEPWFVPGESVTVTLDVQPRPGVLAWAVEEHCPGGWQMEAVSDGGVADAALGQVRWGPFFDAQPRRLSYRLGPPAQAAGLAGLSGCGSFDGQSVPTIGQPWLREACRLAAVPDARGGVRLLLAGRQGARWRIEASTDLQHWEVVARGAWDQTPTPISDPGALEHSCRFYRAVLE